MDSEECGRARMNLLPGILGNTHFELFGETECAGRGLYKAVRGQRMSGCVALGRLLVGIDVTQR